MFLRRVSESLVHRRKSDISYDALKEKMDKAVDWYRIDESLWILYTTSDEDKWYERLEPLVRESGRLLICKLDVSKRHGWMDKDFWSWLRREKKS